VYTIQLNTPAIVGATTAENNSIVNYVFALYERNLNVSTEGISFS